MFLEVFGLTLWLGAPIAIGIGLLALPLVRVLLGEGWLEAVPLIQVLIISGFITLLSSCSHPIFLALNRPELPTVLSALSLVLLFPGLLVGTSHHGVLGAAVAVMVAQISVAIADSLVMMRLLQLGPAAIGAVAWRSIAASSLMAAAVHALMRIWPYHGFWLADLGLLVTAAVLGGLVYLSASLLLWTLFADGRGPERHLVHQIRHRLLCRTPTAAKPGL
jgi:PST family polysaccharide transporter